MPLRSAKQSRKTELPPCGWRSAEAAAFFWARQPLIPCILMPSTKYFWQRKKMIRTGIVMTTATAIIWPIFVVPIEEFRNCMPMATVNFLVELR